MKKSIEIGSRVKAMREDKKLSKEVVAERAGISVAQIESIEEQNLLPSLAPLLKIARVLSVRVGTFLDDATHLGPVISRKDEQNSTINFSSSNTENKKHMTYMSLSKSKTGRHMEPFMINIAPKKDIDFIMSPHQRE